MKKQPYQPGDLDPIAPQITTWQTIKLALWILANIVVVGIGIMLLIKFS